MLSGMRKASKNWLGRVVTTLIMGLLIFSFGIFGIGSWLGSVGQGALAKVGSTEISFDAFRSAFGNELQRLTNQQRRVVTTELAKAAGVDQMVLSTLMSEATLDEQAKQRGLRVSEDYVVKQLTRNPNFKGRDGQFDRARLAEFARQYGYTDKGFVALQRQTTIRQQLTEAVAGGVPAPKTLLDAMNRQRSEERSVSFIRLSTTSLPAIAPPDDAQLQTYYTEHKAEFRAPEYRKLVLINAAMDDFAGDLSISDEDLKLAYDDAVTAGKLGKPERRTFQQIVFNDAAEAKAVSDKILAGTSFAAILVERSLKPDDVTLENQTKAGLADKDVGEVVFALAKGATSPPIAGVFGFTIAHLMNVEAGDVKPFELAKTELVTEARERKIKNSSDIRVKLDSTHDSVEDLRSSGKSLAEVAAALNLKTTTIEAIDATGRDKAGNPVKIADPETSIRTIFTAAIGADTEVIRTRAGSYIWFEVASIEPEHDRPVGDVKAQLSAAWIQAETNRQMANLASDQLKKLTEGASMEDVAKSLNVKIEPATALTRSLSPLVEAQPGSNLLAQIFATEVGSFGQARVEQPIAEAGSNRILFKVTDAHVPPIAADATALKTLGQQLDALYADDLVTEYIKGSQAELGATVNQRLLNSAIGSN